MLPLWGQSGPGNDGVRRISQSYSITGTSPSDCLESYTGHPLWESWHSADIQSVYSTSQATGQITNKILFILYSDYFTLSFFFYVSPSDNKSPCVSKTFLEYSDDPNHAVIWMVSILPLIIPVPFPVLWRLFRVYQQQLVSLSPSYSIGLLILWQGPSICLF